MATINRVSAFIAYEAEAVEVRNYEPTLVPGLLQTEVYAREVSGLGRETDEQAIQQRAANEPPLGYVETIAGDLFLEPHQEIARLNTVYDHLKTLAMSPAESVEFIKEIREHSRARQ